MGRRIAACLIQIAASVCLQMGWKLKRERNDEISRWFQCVKHADVDLQLRVLENFAARLIWAAARHLSLSTETRTPLCWWTMGCSPARDRSWWQILCPRYIRVRSCCHLLWFRAKQPRWEKVESGAPQAGTRHPSPQEIKVNNRELTSCSRNLIMLWSESLQVRVWGSKCVSTEEEVKWVKHIRSNHSFK